MLVNPIKTKSLVNSRSITHTHIFPMLLDGIIVERVTSLNVFVVFLDIKILFESHIRLIAASLSSKLGIMKQKLYACLVIRS